MNVDSDTSKAPPTNEVGGVFDGWLWSIVVGRGAKFCKRKILRYLCGAKQGEAPMIIYLGGVHRQE